MGQETQSQKEEQSSPHLPRRRKLNQSDATGAVIACAAVGAAAAVSGSSSAGKVDDSQEAPLVEITNKKFEMHSHNDVSWWQEGNVEEITESEEEEDKCTDSDVKNEVEDDEKEQLLTDEKEEMHGGNNVEVTSEQLGVFSLIQNMDEKSEQCCMTRKFGHFEFSSPSIMWQLQLSKFPPAAWKMIHVQKMQHL